MKKIVRYTLYLLILLPLLYILFNNTARRLFLRYIDKYNLESNIKIAQQVNSEYKKRLYYLETKPSHMDRIVKSELGVVAHGEVEYRFKKNSQEKQQEQNEN